MHCEPISKKLFPSAKDFPARGYSSGLEKNFSMVLKEVKELVSCRQQRNASKTFLNDALRACSNLYLILYSSKALVTQAKLF